MLTSQVSLTLRQLTLWLNNLNYNLVFSNAICPTLWKRGNQREWNYCTKAEATVPPLGLKRNLGSRRNSSTFIVHSLFLTKLLHWSVLIDVFIYLFCDTVVLDNCYNVFIISLETFKYKPFLHNCLICVNHHINMRAVSYFVSKNIL